MFGLDFVSFALENGLSISVFESYIELKKQEGVWIASQDDYNEILLVLSSPNTSIRMKETYLELFHFILGFSHYEGKTNQVLLNLVKGSPFFCNLIWELLEKYPEYKISQELYLALLPGLTIQND